MIGTKWLSEAINMDSLEKNIINLVVAPTGCGKTKWAFEHLAKTASHINKVLYLIDTTIGKQSLLQKPETTVFSDTHIEVVKGKFFSTDESKILVMTYAQFGYWSRVDKGFWKAFEIVICDEIQNLVRFYYFDQSPTNLCRIAMTQINEMICKSDILIVGLTATPKKVIDFMTEDCISSVDVGEDLKQHETKETFYYANIDELIKRPRLNEVGIIYTGRITRMKYIHEVLSQLGIPSICIWSINNLVHPMGEEQLAAREYIIKKEKLPPYYNVVIINDSCGTCINIEGDIDYMIIHHQEDDTRTQVRGRYRDDLDKLYLLDHKKALENLQVPEEYMDKWLSKQDRSELCIRLGLRDNQNRLVGWTTTKKKIAAAGYLIEKKRIKDIVHYKITL